jgi:hypothetical protein
LVQDFYQNPRYADSIIDIGAAEAILNLSTDSVLVYNDSVRFFGTVLFSPDSNKTMRGFSFVADSTSLTDIVVDSGNGSYSAVLNQHLSPATYYYQTWGQVNNKRYPGLIRTFKVCSIDTTKENVNICNGENYTFPDDSTLNNITYDTAYTSHLKAVNGCDSLVTTFVTVNHVDTLIALYGDTLVAHASPAQYQWLDCNNGHTPISGATAQSFTPEQNGIYAVEITQNACVDTSSCYTITTVGIVKNSFENNIQLVPNPTNGKVFIRTTTLTQEARIEVLNTVGQVVIKNIPGTMQVDLSALHNGLYFIRITDQGHQLVKKILLKKH